MAPSPRQRACDYVYRKYPMMKGVRPASERAGSNRVYTFKKTVTTSAGGPRLSQMVRVTVDPSGRIVKVVASR